MLSILFEKMKKKSKLRDYKINTPQYEFYKELHKNQTYNYVKAVRTPSQQDPSGPNGRSLTTGELTSSCLGVARPARVLCKGAA